MQQRWQTRLAAFDDMAAKWKPVHLRTLQEDDSDKLRLAKTREKIALARKEVSVITKDFAKLDDEGRLAQFGVVLKAYQGHVDDLTKALRFAEGAYAALHDTVGTLTDPYPLLERFTREKQGIIEMAKAAETVEQLQRTVREREAELEGLTNQEVTIQMLRESLAEAELRGAAAVQKSATDASSELDHVLRQWQHSEVSMQKEIASLTQKCRALELSQLDAASYSAELQERLLHLANERDDATTALLEELEGANTKATLEERERMRLSATVEELREQVETLAAERDEYHDLAAALTAERDVAVSEATTLKKKREMEEGTDPNNDSSRSLVKLCGYQDGAIDAAQSFGDVFLAAREDEWRALSRSLLQPMISALQAANDERTSLQSQRKMWDTERGALLQSTRSLEQALQQLESQQQRQQQRQDPHSQASSSQDPSVRGHAAPTAFSLEHVLTEPQSSAKQTPATTTTSGTVASTPSMVEAEDTFTIVAGQRDKLRQRLLAMEAATSFEIDRLNGALREANTEIHNLRQLVTGGSSSNTASSSSSFLSTAVQFHGDDEKVERPLLITREGVSQEAVVEVLDRSSALLSRHVLTVLPARRLFMAYLLVLHTWWLLSTLLWLIW